MPKSRKTVKPRKKAHGGIGELEKCLIRDTYYLYGPNFELQVLIRNNEYDYVKCSLKITC